MIQHEDRQNERRHSRRFPMNCSLQGHLIGKDAAFSQVSGQTINMSSSGILFTTQERLLLGRRMELAVSWPALLNRECPLKFVVRGRIVRNDPNCSAVTIEHYEFRTAGKS